MGKLAHEIAPKAAIKKLISDGKTTSTIGQELKNLIIQSKIRWNYIKNNYDELPVYNPGNNPLMLLQKEKSELPICVIYNHVDPETGEIIYIGKGPHCRAYETFLRRKHFHALWFLEKINEGFDMLDLVQIIETGLIDEDAFKQENKSLKAYKKKYGSTPMFNSDSLE